jgi:hypothetical protein
LLALTLAVLTFLAGGLTLALGGSLGLTFALALLSLLALAALAGLLGILAFAFAGSFAARRLSAVAR